MKVFVIGLNGTRLMPMSPQKARKLLNSNKAEVYKKRPFTIKLLYKTGSTTQPVDIGIDTGSQHIGVGITSDDKVLYKADIKLRDSMEKRSLLETRATYRRGRRYRKVRYRKPKFRFHTKRVYSEELVTRKSTKHKTHWVKVTNSMDANRKEGWLPPSIQSKLEHHINWINRYMDVLPKNTKLHIEIARFDAARMENPEIHGELYQKGPQYDHENIKAYVFARDGYKCRCCGAKGGSIRKDGTTVKLAMHHILMKSKGATDNPKYLATVCDKCHTGINHKDGELYEWYCKLKPSERGYRDTVIMNVLRKRLYNYFPEAEYTYGNITAADRKSLLLEKTHANDAVAIAAHGRGYVKDISNTVFFVQVRKKKRSLHEAMPRKGRKEPNRFAKRNEKNTKQVGKFHVYDRVQLGNRVGWITGFTGTSGAYIKDKNDNYITETGKTYKQVALSKLKLLTSNNNWIHYEVEPLLG